MANVYEAVTERIIAALENNIIPWRKEWKAKPGAFTTMPTNYISKKPYRGINIIVLSCASYGSPYWLTYKQAQSIGAQVRRGEKGTPIVFWKFDAKRKNAETGEEESIVIAVQYTVFNLEQCDGIPAVIPDGAVDEPKFIPLEAAETIAQGYLTRPGSPSLSHSGDRAYYASLPDHVQMPKPEAFNSPEAYYSTLYHELAHSTGHGLRLNRYEIGEAHAFGSESYSKEELVAEFTAAFLCGESGINNQPVEANQVAYIQSWLGRLRNDKTLAVSAAQRAQKAADYILNRNVQNETGEAQQAA